MCDVTGKGRDIRAMYSSLSLQFPMKHLQIIFKSDKYRIFRFHPYRAPSAESHFRYIISKSVNGSGHRTLSYN